MTLTTKRQRSLNEEVEANYFTPQDRSFFTSLLKDLKKTKWALSFLHPVDEATLSTTDNTKAIKQPMDLGTITNKLQQDKYTSREQCINDIQLVFDNCYHSNDSTSNVYYDARKLEGVFKKGILKMPPKCQKVLNHEHIKMMPADQWRRCEAIVKEMKRPKYENFTYPFVAPVDPIACGAPDYFDVIKYPMDMSTYESKLYSFEYAFENELSFDIRLMLENCFKYNPPGHEILKNASEFQKVFEQKWSYLHKDTTRSDSKDLSESSSQQKQPKKRKMVSSCNVQIEQYKQQHQHTQNASVSQLLPMALTNVSQASTSVTKPELRKEVIFKQRNPQAQSQSKASSSAPYMRRKPYRRPQQKKSSDSFLSLDSLVDKITQKNEIEKLQEFPQKTRKEMDEEINEKKKDRVKELVAKEAEDLSNPRWRAARFERTEMSSDPDWYALKSYQYHTHNYRELPMPGFVMNNGGIDRLLQLKEEFLKKAELLKKAQSKN